VKSTIRKNLDTDTYDFAWRWEFLSCHMSRVTRCKMVDISTILWLIKCRNIINSSQWWDI
jgi:hypothetical protein